MRRFFFALVFMLAALVIAVLFALRSQNNVIALASWASETFAGLTLQLVDAQIDVYAGKLSASEVHLLPVGTDGPALLSILDLQASVPASIRADSVLVYLAESEEETNPKPVQWLGYLRWLPTELRIETVHLITASENTWIFPLMGLRGDRLEADNYFLSATAGYEGEPLRMIVELAAIDEGWGASAAEGKVTVVAPDSGSTIALNGTLAGTEIDFNYNVVLLAEYKDIRDFFKGFEGGTDLAGRLELKGNMLGDSKGFQLSNAVFYLNNSPAYKFEAAGTLAYQFSGESRLDLSGTGELDSLSYLLAWLDLDLSEFGRAQSSIRLGGSLDKPVAEALTLTTANQDGLVVSVTGRLKLYDDPTELQDESSAVELTLTGPSLSVLEQWTGELPYDPGPWQAKTRLIGNPSRASLRDIQVQMGTLDGLRAMIDGEIAYIGPQVTDEGERYDVSGIDITVNATAPNLVPLIEVLELSSIPAEYELVGSLRLTGTLDEMMLSDANVTATGDDSELQLGPLSGVLFANEDRVLSSLDGPVRFTADGLSVFSDYTSLALPELGSLTVAGHLQQDDASFELNRIDARLGNNELSINATGRVGDLTSLNAIALDIVLSEVPVNVLAALAFPQADALPELGMLSGGIEIERATEEWSLREITVVNSAPNERLFFEIRGAVEDILGVIRPELDARYVLNDPQLLEELMDRPLPPVSGELEVRSQQDDVLAETNVIMGQTEVHIKGKLQRAGNTPSSLALSFETPYLYLSDLGFSEETVEGPVEGAVEDPVEDIDETDNSLADEPAQTNEQDASTTLAMLRENAPPFPVSADFSIGGIGGEYSAIDSLKLRLVGVDNRYTLEEFTARYNQAETELRGIIDLNPELPAISLAGQATTMPLGAILRDFGLQTNVTGELTLLGGVTLIGDSTEALIANSNGSVAFALEEAVIEGAAYDLLATDLLAWIYSGALAEDSTYIDCTMAKFDIRQGIATSDSLYIESSKMIATGKAEFDLPRQRMDVRITPRSKSRLLQVPSEVRLKGKMSDPNTDISAVGTVADATAAAIMLIPDLTMKLFGIGQSDSDNLQPCRASLN
ncbi:MAG: AsmA-like C-terminal region-containing protein [Pseudomonadota bacterium]